LSTRKTNKQFFKSFECESVVMNGSCSGHLRPTLLLPIDDPYETREVECVEALLVPSVQPPPGARVEPTPQPGGLRSNALGLAGPAERILSNGGLSIAAMQVGVRAYQLVVDISGVPMINGIGVLKGLILDSWIVASNGLAPAAGRLRVEEAVVRALLMLLVKRVLSIRQLGPAREVLTLLNFISLAAVSMQSANFDTNLASTLAEIASLPSLFYTAMARVVVDARARDWFVDNNTAELRKQASNLNLGKSAKGSLGKKGGKLKRDWKEMLETNPVLRAHVRKHAVYDAGRAELIVNEFVRVGG